MTCACSSQTLKAVEPCHFIRYHRFTCRAALFIVIVVAAIFAMRTPVGHLYTMARARILALSGISTLYGIRDGLQTKDGSRAQVSAGMHQISPKQT